MCSIFYYRFQLALPRPRDSFFESWHEPNEVIVYLM
jgi:hypothetical protein